MKVFFLDDSRERIHKAAAKFASPQGDFVAALDAASAIRHLQEADTIYDVVSLDHDLVGVYCPSDDLSGFAVAEFITGMPVDRLPKKIICHSWNYEAKRTPPRGGVGNMLDVLQPITYNTDVIAAPFDSPEYWEAVL